MTLADLQRDFVAYLKGDGSGIVEDVHTASLRGLPVYHFAYRASLVAALRDTFERTHAWLGDHQFDDAARAHIIASPPSSWTMSDFGLGFDRTLDGLYPNDPEVAELAWLDWSMRRAFDGADSGTLDTNALTDIDWDTAQLHLAPTLVMRTVSTNCAELWRALADDQAPPPACLLLPAPVALTVWRQDLSPRFLSVGSDEHMALTMAADGVAFGPICEQLVNDDRDAAAVSALAGTMLARWIADGVLVGVRQSVRRAGTSIQRK